MPTEATPVPTPQASPRRSRVWLVLGGLGALAAASVATVKAMTASPEPAASSAVTAAAETKAAPAKSVSVTVAPVRKMAARRSIAVTGTLRAWEEVPVTAKAEGRAERVRRDTGERVKAGDLLLELDTTDAKLAVEEASRAFELELAKLGVTELPAPGTFDVTTLPSVAKAEAEERNAAERLARAERQGRAASAEELALRGTELAVAKAASRQSRLEAEVALASARQRLAVLAVSRQRLADCAIAVPPVPGEDGRPADLVVARRSVAPGEYVRNMPGESKPLFLLQADRVLKYVAQVPERYDAQIKPGLPVELRIEGYADRFAGTVRRVDPAIDRQSRTLTVEARVPNPDGRLRPGGFAKAEIVLGTAEALAVPPEAVVRFAGVTKVVAARDGKAADVPVREGVALTGPGGEPLVEVSGALTMGESVLTSGQSQAAPGVALRVREEGN